MDEADLSTRADAAPEARLLAALAAAVAAWIGDARSSGDVAEAAARCAKRLQNSYSSLGAVLAGQPEGPLREAARLALSLAQCRVDRDAVRALFSAGWSPRSVAGAATAILYVEIGRARRPWETALLELVAREPSHPLSGRALAAQIAVAKFFGEDRAACRGSLITAIRRRAPAHRIERLASELVWLSDDRAMTQPLFGRFGGLGRAASEDAMIAALARRSAWHRVPREARPAALSLARRVEALERMSAAFWKKLADRSLRIAVVGNSPCETGLGRGAEIDSHDLVVRFNDAPEGAGFAADYGGRCDVKAFAKRSAARWETSRAATIVLTRQDAMLANGMATPNAILAAGRVAAFVPNAIVRDLRRRLDAGPSTGIILLAQLRALRGGLRGVSCFGFSMVDQIGPDAASSHYFADARGHANHAWRAERALLDTWLAEAAAER